MKPRRRKQIVLKQNGPCRDLFESVRSALDHFEVPTEIKEADLIRTLWRLDRALAKQPLSVRAACHHSELRTLLEWLT